VEKDQGGEEKESGGKGANGFLWSYYLKKERKVTAGTGKGEPSYLTSETGGVGEKGLPEGDVKKGIPMVTAPGKISKNNNRGREEGGW